MRRPTTPYGWSLVIAACVGVGLVVGFAAVGCWTLAVASLFCTAFAAFLQQRVVP